MRAISKKRTSDKNRDILGVLLSLVHNPTNEFSSSFSRDTVKALMIITQVTATWVFSVLLKHPRVIKLVRTELHEVVGRERMGVESDLLKLTDLDMVMKETFRYLAAPILVPHESLEDVILDGYAMPKKSRILVNFWAISRGPNVWSENVEKFCRERFKDRDVDVRGEHFELIPFGARRRLCQADCSTIDKLF